MKTNIIVLSLLCLMVGCNSKSKQAKSENDYANVEIINEMEEGEEYFHQRYIPADFNVYIDSIFDSIPDFHHNHYETLIVPTLSKLQAYKDGKRKYYPQEDVVQLLNYLQDEYAYACLHATEENIDQLLLLFKTVLELAVRTTPDINFLSNVCSLDHRVGVLIFHDCFSYCPYYAVIYDVTDQHEFDVHWMTDEYQSTELTYIRFLEEDDYRLRYLVTAEEQIPLNNLVHEIVWLVDWYWETGEMKSFRADILAADAKKWAEAPEYEYVCYNPKKRIWQYCTTINDVLQPIPNAPVLQFHLTPEGKGCYLKVE